MDRDTLTHITIGFWQPIERLVPGWKERYTDRKNRQIDRNKHIFNHQNI